MSAARRVWDARLATCLVATLLCVAAASSPVSAQDVRSDQVAAVIKAMRGAGFKVETSERVPELTQPQQSYDRLSGNSSFNWIDGLEGGKAVRLEVTSPSGRTKTVVYGLEKPGRGLEMDPREMAHLARSQNFGVTDILGPNWRQLYPQVDVNGTDWDKQVALGNLSGLLYRPEPADMGVPRPAVIGDRPGWQKRGLSAPTLRNRLSGAEFSYDEADADVSWVNTDRERLAYPGGTDPYPVLAEPEEDESVEILDPDLDLTGRNPERQRALERLREAERQREAEREEQGE